MVKKMKVIRVIPYGYCKGVVNAINLVKKEIENNTKANIHLLGNIIHNKFVKDALVNENVIIHDTFGKSRLELLDEIEDGIVIFSAHGVSDTTREKAIAKGLQIIDASCEDVLKTQIIIKEYLANQYTIFYIGKEHHPEAEAMIGLDSNRIILVTSDSVIPRNISGKTVVTCQTTMSLFEVRELVDSLMALYPETIFMDEICNATRLRQEALLKLNPKEMDLLIIVGDLQSNNTNSLRKIAQAQGMNHIILIESINDLDESLLLDVNVVGITAGASTPPYIVTTVIEYLELFPTVKKEAIDYSKVL